jgi:transcriptional regulator with XRE-family HTH domain
MENNEKKQRGVAERLRISTSTLHDILRKGQMPSLRLAYEIEQYTRGAITLYDWIDQPAEEKKVVKKNKTTLMDKKIKR